MAWVPPDPTSAVGRLHIAYSSGSSAVVRTMMSYVDVERLPNRVVKTPRVGIATYFDNVWRTANGVDLFFEEGVDSNLRAVLAFANEKQLTQLWFHPKADGINDTTYTNHNDWAVLGRNLCGELVNPGGLVDNPVRCGG
ncbi:hypothetical protein ABN028_27640 [Actinopolymorpha sp. B17G11]|uniref:hypothetical protein n=1 Tax=Actinopolymorpha sp. B17G11 TaxID=3160861 RepID=UPI0032E448D3